MSARPGNASAVPHERGFVLVGVVMFVLALTILGLSVFSLSSYEAQFLNKTLDQNRAFYAAQGGMERSRFVLSATGMLETAQSNLPAGVDSAIAKQWQAPDTVTSGPLEWGGEDIVIKVSAHVNGERTTLWGRYRPSQLDDYYKRLITCDTLRINEFITNGFNPNDPPNPPTPPVCRYTVAVNGRVWTGFPDSSWKTVAKPFPMNGVRTDPVPTPSAASFIAAHPAPMPAYNLLTNTYTLNGNSTAPTYYGFPTLPFNLPFSLLNNLSAPTIHVRGRCVWMFPAGVYFSFRLNVVDDGDSSCLVIVGGASGLNAFGEKAGIWCFGGIDSDVPLILVSNDRVVLEHFNGQTSNSNTGYLSIFAKSVQFSGPWLNQSPSRFMFLNHPVNAPEDLDGGLIDWLSERGALPNATASNGTELTLRPGTWTELTP